MNKEKCQPFYWLDIRGIPLCWPKLLVCGLLFSPTLKGNTQQISLSYAKSPLKSVLRDIKLQSGYDFL